MGKSVKPQTHKQAFLPKSAAGQSSCRQEAESACAEGTVGEALATSGVASISHGDAGGAEDTEDWMLQQALAAAMKGMSKDDEIPGLHSSSPNALPESVAPPVAAAPRATP